MSPYSRRGEKGRGLTDRRGDRGRGLFGWDGGRGEEQAAFVLEVRGRGSSSACVVGICNGGTPETCQSYCSAVNGFAVL